MYGKLSITRLFSHLAIFRNLFWCRLMNIFLTQFWTEKLLIHKPQPRHILSNCTNLFKSWLYYYFNAILWKLGKMNSQKKRLSVWGICGQAIHISSHGGFQGTFKYKVFLVNLNFVTILHYFKYIYIGKHGVKYQK